MGWSCARSNPTYPVSLDNLEWSEPQFLQKPISENALNLYLKYYFIQIVHCMNDISLISAGFIITSGRSF